MIYFGCFEDIDMYSMVLVEGGKRKGNKRNIVLGFFLLDCVWFFNLEFVLFEIFRRMYEKLKKFEFF